MYFGFVSQPTVFNQDSLCDYWFGILKWSLLGSPVAAELKTMTPSPPEKELIVQQGRVEPYKSLLHPQLTGPVLGKPSAGNNSFWEFMVTMAVSCSVGQYFTALLPTLHLLYLFHTYSSIFPEPFHGEKGKNILFKAEHFPLILSTLNSQASVLTFI